MKRIVTALSSKNRGLTRRKLTEKTGISDGGELSSQLKALIVGDFIMKYCSFGNSRREEYYKLTDPFCIFYLKFVKDSQKNWLDKYSRQQSGDNMERICFLKCLLESYQADKAGIGNQRSFHNRIIMVKKSRWGVRRSTNWSNHWTKRQWNKSLWDKILQWWICRE